MRKLAELFADLKKLECHVLQDAEPEREHGERSRHKHTAKESPSAVERKRKEERKVNGSRQRVRTDTASERVISS